MEETLTLMKFQGLSLSKEFLKFEAEVEERASGIKEAGGLVAYRPEDK